MANNEEAYKKLYRALFVTILSVSTAFFIYHITVAGVSEEGMRDLGGGVSYASWISHNIPLCLGYALLLAIFGATFYFPTKWWINNSENISSSNKDLLCLITCGAFPYFMQNLVGFFVQVAAILKQQQHGSPIYHLVYMFLYTGALIFYKWFWDIVIQKLRQILQMMVDVLKPA